MGVKSYTVLLHVNALTLYAHAPFLGMLDPKGFFASLVSSNSLRGVISPKLRFTFITKIPCNLLTLEPAVV